jgi:hypothetical protein
MSKLPLGSRALLHLYDVRREGEMDTVGEEITQIGISKSLGIPRSHMTRVLKPLLRSNCIEEDKRHIRGRDRKMKVYSITSVGVNDVMEILESMSDREVRVREMGRSMNTTVGHVLERPNISVLKLIDCALDESTLEVCPKRIIQCDHDLRTRDLIDREDALAAAQQFLEGDVPTLVILANRGYGTSSLMRNLALEMTDRPLMWHDLSTGGDGISINDDIDCFLEKMGCRSLDELQDTESLLCFDNYHLVPENGVDTLMDIREGLDGGSAKMVIAMRRENPSYNRFHQREDVERGRVKEIVLGRLGTECVGKMFGEDTDPEASRLIYMMTRGQPLSLQLLKEGDEESLRRIYPAEEVRFMMYLRTKKVGGD